MTAPGPAAPGAAAAAANPQAAINQHAAATGATNPADQAIITRVETAIQHSPMGWLQSVLGDANSKHSTEHSAAEGKVQEMNQEVSANAHDAPADAGPAPQPGPATTAHVAQPAAAQQGPAGVPGRPGPQGGAHHPHAGGRAPARGAAPGGQAAHATISGALGQAAGEDDFKRALNEYPHKAPEATEQLGRIKQMGDIARGFNGQLDTYVAHSSGGLSSVMAGSINFLGVGRNVNAVWENNPYRKANDTLGHIMTGLSAIKQVTGIVGSICGKLGLILTVVGLLGMIFPPIGTAVSGVARVLNVVGIICDAISFVISGILVGLNGVRLAKQIAAGGSAEEKAATAELMMTEANDAAGSMINLAMAFGPKFMKGLMEKSKGFINGLMRRMRAFVGNITQRIAGNVRNFANRLLRGVGMGGVKARLVNGAWQAERGAMARAGDWVKSGAQRVANSRVGQAARTAWNAPGRGINAARDRLMAKFGTSRFATGLERFGARAGQMADRMDLSRAAESAGERLGNIGAGSARGKAMQEAAEAAERRNLELQAAQAANDARDLEQRRIQYELSQRTANGGNAKRNLEGDKDYLSHGGRQNRRINAAGTAASSSVTNAATQAEQTAAQAEAKQAQAAADFQNNPQAYQQQVTAARNSQQALEQQYATQEAQRAALLRRSESTLSEAEKAELARLNTTLKPLDDARAASQAMDAQMYSMASGGGTRKPGVQTMGDAASTLSSTAATWRKIMNRSHSWESKESFDFKDPLKWDGKGASSGSSGRGGRGDFAAISAASQQAQRNDFHNFVARQPRLNGVAARARQMLANVGRRNQAPAPSAPQVSAPPQPSTTAQPAGTPSAAPTATATPSGPDPSAAAPATPNAANAPSPAASGPAATANASASAGATPAATPTPAANPAATQAAGGADPGAAAGGGEPLPYWPKLLDPAGDGTYANAIQEFGYMRRVAVEFKKAQEKGKQEAVDTLATYGRYEEYAAARQAQAQQHQQGTQQTSQETQGSQQAAAQGQAQGAQGEGRQNEARSNSNAPAPNLPEPEVRGFWGRIIGRIKRWAKQKAAQIFGWLQEKIASVILRGLCGVSMGDLKDYAGALRHQQQAAQGVADQGANTAGQASQANITLQGNAAKEAQDAVVAISSCDQNIAEADRFMHDVNDYEQQVRSSAAAAQQFINTLHSEWQAQRAQQQAQAAQAAQASQGPDAHGMDGGVPQQDASAPAATQDNADTSVDDAAMCGPDDASADPAGGAHEEDHAAPEDVSDVRAAAGYVSSSAAGAIEEVNATKTDYLNQLRTATVNRGHHGQSILSNAEDRAGDIASHFEAIANTEKGTMDGIGGQDISASTLTTLVQTIIRSATSLDSASDEAHRLLTGMFRDTYSTLQNAGQGWVAGGFDAVNDAAAPIDHAANSGIDNVQHGADAAWNASADAVGSVANPVADAAVTGLSYPARAVEVTGMAVTSPVWAPAGAAMNAAVDDN